MCAAVTNFSILTEDDNQFEKVEELSWRISSRGWKRARRPVCENTSMDALHYAVLNPGDLIAVIGKGHETYRNYGWESETPFLERELLEEYAHRIGFNKPKKGKKATQRQAAFLLSTVAGEQLISFLVLGNGLVNNFLGQVVVGIGVGFGSAGRTACQRKADPWPG